MNGSFTNQKSALVAIFVSFLCTLALAEGTKQLAPDPTDICMLNTSKPADNLGRNFATIGGPDATALYLRISDTSELVLIGLSNSYNEDGTTVNTNSPFQFRILDPNGNVVHGNFSIGVGGFPVNADSWSLAQGPDALVGGGYDTTTATFPYAVFRPDTVGDFRIEFFDPLAGPGFGYIKYFDFTVLDTLGAEKPGRLWSLAWAFRTPPISDIANPPLCNFDRPFNGALFSYTMDGFVSKIDFNGSGFRGLNFSVAFGMEGPGMTGDIFEDRRSIPNVNAAIDAADHMVFLSEPDSVEFVSMDANCGAAEILGLECLSMDNFCIRVGATQMGQVEILLDFPGDAQDTLLAMMFAQPDTACITWDGTKGDGTKVIEGEEIPITIRYAQGVQHLPAFDVEFLESGFCVETVRPMCAGMNTLLYWDDSKLTGIGDTSGTGQPKVLLEGCPCQVDSCRTWTNIDVGMNCTGIDGYGNDNTLNTWWFANLIETAPETLQVIQVSIDGVVQFCPGDSTELAAVPVPAANFLDYVYSWSGPGGYMSSDSVATGIMTAGSYIVLVEDTATNCTAMDTVDVTELVPPQITLDTNCMPDMNVLAGNIDLTVSGPGGPPFTFMWSNGTMDQNLVGVQPGTYSVTVTDTLGCSTIDSITLDTCCELVVSCPPSPTTVFDCLDDIPAPDINDITVSRFCEDFTIMSEPDQLIGTGCGDDTLMLIRMYSITDDAMNETMCMQLYQVVDDEAPVLDAQTCPGDTSVLCTEDASVGALGMPSYTDNCVDQVMPTFRDDSTGFDGTCTANVLGTITRTFFAEDTCGNIDSSCVQMIMIIDTIPPVVLSCPADIGIECGASADTADLGVPTYTDACGLEVVVSFTDDSIGFDGSCSGNVIGQIQRTFFGTDPCDNVDSSCVQTISVIDSVAPTFTVPADVTIDCDGDTSAMALGMPMDIMDNCDTSNIVVSRRDSIELNGCPSIDTIFRIWTATDPCGNATTAIQTILREDNEAPTFTPPADATIACDGDTSATALGMPMDVDDNCDSMNVTVTRRDSIMMNGCPSLDTIFRIWMAVDPCGNDTSIIQTIVRVDDEPPTFTPPADATIECDADTSATALGMPMDVDDNCDSMNVTIARRDSIEINGCPATDTVFRIWTAIDGCGNDTSVIQTIVRVDNEAPTFTPPADATIECDADTSATALGMPMDVDDNCDSMNVTIARRDSIMPNGCPTLDTIFRLWTATDPCGNDTTIIQTIVRDDTTPPMITCPPTATVECPLNADTSITGVAFGMDNCTPDSLLMLTFDDDSSDFSMTCPAGTIMRTFTLTPECGPTASCVQTINVVDDVPPSFTVPADITLMCGADILDLDLTGRVMDVSDCNGVLDTTFIDSAMNPACGQTIQRTWTVSDSCGNDSSAVQNITLAAVASGQFACNDHVNMTVDLNCDIFVSVDRLLEGDVTDPNSFTVAVEGYGEAAGGILINQPVFNTRLEFVVTSQAGLSCWGELTFEDKSPPVLDCQDVTLECGDPTDSDLYEPSATDACGGEVDLTFRESKSGDECSNIVITRIWTATDQFGNSATCEQTIAIEPLTLDGLAWPGNFTGTCSESSLPSNTGYPTIDGEDIVEGGLCNIFATYKDKELDDCGGGVKIVRNWTVLDWCTQEIRDTVQVVKLTDEDAPVIDCQDDITIGVDPWYCLGETDLETPDVSDPCGTPWTLSATSSAGAITENNGQWSVSDLPLGVHRVTWTAVDDCGNSSTCIVEIQVEDDIPPVPACDEHTVVSISDEAEFEFGIVKVAADVFDDGSYDACGEVTFEARRMRSCINFDWTTGGAGVDETKDGRVTGKDTGRDFGPKVPFACCDVDAGSIMIELRVTDEAGNSNTCMVEAVVQDKLAPELVPPPHITVSCEFWFDVRETNGYVSQDEDVLSDVFGRVLNEFDNVMADREEITINDPGNTSQKQPFTWGIDGWAEDNCAVEVTVDVDIVDDCTGRSFDGSAPENAVRLITRRFRAADKSISSAFATQEIWVVDFDPLERRDIDWPADCTITECPDEGVNCGEPVVPDDNCSLVGITFDDTRFDFVEDACYKIIREWTVIDWCQYDGNSATAELAINGADVPGYFTYTQVIKVRDEDAPEFIVEDPDITNGAITLCVADEGVTLPATNQVFTGEGSDGATKCGVHVNQSFDVLETCSGEVTYDVKVFPNNGDEFIVISGKKTVPVEEDGRATLSFNTSDAGLATENTGLPYNDRYCDPRVGGEKQYHRVLWTVEDGCGNQNTLSYLLRLEDCKEPTPVCVNLSSVVMPSTGEVTIWAADFNAKSFDDCTAADDLLFSFDGDEYQPDLKVDCDDLIENGSLTFIVEVWVADEGNDLDCNGVITWDERNKDFCTTFIVIDDNERKCRVAFPIAGDIETEEYEAVSNVEVSLKDFRGEVVNKYMTGDEGRYRFVNPFLEYTVEPSRNDDHRNGVTTLDLVRIQQHLLGIKLLESPYKLIAADANNSKTISALDLVEIRRLILGVYVEYPENSSWRFVDRDFAFTDPYKPWPFDEVIELESQGQEEDFVAIKIGDVNGTVVANAQDAAPKTRSAAALDLHLSNMEVEAGESISVAFSAYEFENVYGMQQTLELNGLQLTGMTAGALDLGPENMASFKRAATLSWSSPVPRTEQGVLFEMQFDVLEDGMLSDMLNVSSRITENEAYVSTGGDIATADIGLVFDDIKTIDNNYVLYQNRPNPLTSSTVIGFNLPDAAAATLTVFDVSGKVINVVEGDYPAGYSEIVLRRSELQATGVVYYRLDTDGFTGTRKMILID